MILIGITTGKFGSPYSMYSACNPCASDPPVIVDENGNAYVRLTLNRSDIVAPVVARN